MQFKANGFLTILAILVLALLISLGSWQVSRAQEKQALLDLQSARMNLEPVELMTVNLADDSLRYLPVSVSGQFDAQQQILIDNQVKNGWPGYFVLTPLKLIDDRAILINRGWLPMGRDRSDLPDVSYHLKQVTLSGKLEHFPSVGIKLEGADELTLGWPAVTQVVDIKKISARLGYEIQSYQILLNSDEQNGYDRDWVPMKMGPEKHHGYAFQWFALAVAWVVLYFVVTIKVSKRD